MIQLSVKKRTGFTLIELLVVISIMSILTVITVSQFQTARRKARDVQRKADLNSLSKALQMYYTDYGFFPQSNPVTIGGGISMPGAVWGGTFEDQTVSPAYVYMKVLPKENTDSTHPYCYKVSADRKMMALFGQLENSADVECDRNKDGRVDASDTRACDGVQYCYYITSPNAALDINGDLK